MTLRIATLKRTYFEEYEGWGRSYYVETTPLTYAEYKKVEESRAAAADEKEAEKIAVTVVKEHIAGGVVPALDDDNNRVDAAFKAEHVEQLTPDMILKIFYDVIGAPYDDPKATAEPSSTSAIETSSSEASQETAS